MKYYIMPMSIRYTEEFKRDEVAQNNIPWLPIKIRAFVNR
jgi:hypothetical protein